MHYGTFPVASVFFTGKLSVGLVFEGPGELAVELLIVFEVTMETRTIDKF